VSAGATGSAGATVPAVWTVLGLLEWSTAHLQERGIDSPRLTAELLLGRVLTLERIGLYTNFDRPLSAAELASYKALLKRRLGREPVQYILGEGHFMGLRFAVDPSVLIPRPETEGLVERVIEIGRLRPGAVGRVLDIGTGSGCIAASIARLVPSARLDAVDVSPAALACARANALSLGVQERIAFSESDILAEPYAGPRGPYDLVVSNPPYVSAREFATLEPEVREFEPALATTDRGDGLTFYRAIARLAPALLAPGGRVLVEVAFDQAPEVTRLFQAAGAARITAHKDHAGIERVVEAEGF
jgi:release factor glutamine methyltransferase